jgi:hypothetical protein
LSVNAASPGVSAASCGVEGSIASHVVTLNEQEIASGAFVAGIHAAIPDQIPDAILHA